MPYRSTLPVRSKRGAVHAPTPGVALMSSRRFPVPWTAEETDACFFVGIHNGLAVAYVYIEGG
jgi:hypothetical protein